jgi:hypothetical protein
MSEHRFDPTDYYRFDLAHGTLGIAGQDGGAVVVPFGAIDRPLATEAGAAATAVLASAFGGWIGIRLRERLSGEEDPVEVSPERFLSELNGLLTLHGLGRWFLETHGDVLLIRAAVPSMVPGRRGQLIEAFFSALLGSFLSKDVRCVSLDDGEFPCILVGGAGVFRRVEGWMEQGWAPEAIAARLQHDLRAARESRP